MFSFEIEQPSLGRGAVTRRIMAESAIRADHAVAGHDQRIGIARAALADGAGRGAKAGGETAITFCITERNIDHPSAQRGTTLAVRRFERQLEERSFAGEPLFELIYREAKRSGCST